MAIEVCAHCREVIKPEGRGRFCNRCGKDLAVATMDEKDFVPLLLAVDMCRELKVGENTLCHLYFRNLDFDAIRNVKVRIRSSILKEWEGRVRRIPPGMSVNPAETAELLTETPGETVLRFSIEYMDPHGAFRPYDGRVIIKISSLPQAGQSTHYNLTLSSAGDMKVMGNDLSNLFQLPNANLRPESAPADVCRILIPLELDEERYVKRKETTKVPPPLPPPKAELFARARLVFEGRERGRKVLLLTKPEIVVGMKKFTKTGGVDLTLRLLPCRSEQLDPWQWHINRQISSPHFSLAARDDHFEIRDEEHSKAGTCLIHLAGGEPEPPRTVGDGDTVLETPVNGAAESADDLPAIAETEEETKPLPKGQWVALPRLCRISVGRRLVLLQAQTFRGSRGDLYALRLRRIDNRPELEYIHLVKRVYIGSASKCAIRIADKRFPPVAAALNRGRDRFTLIAGVSSPPIRLNGQPVAQRHTAEMTPPCRIEIGDYAWRFEEASIEDFTEI